MGKSVGSTWGAVLLVAGGLGFASFGGESASFVAAGVEPEPVVEWFHRQRIWRSRIRAGSAAESDPPQLSPPLLEALIHSLSRAA